MIGIVLIDLSVICGTFIKKYILKHATLKIHQAKVEKEISDAGWP